MKYSTHNINTHTNSYTHIQLQRGTCSTLFRASKADDPRARTQFKLSINIAADPVADPPAARTSPHPLTLPRKCIDFDILIAFRVTRQLKLEVESSEQVLFFFYYCFCFCFISPTLSTLARTLSHTYTHTLAIALTLAHMNASQRQAKQ